jgi:hypothetical protein
MRGVSEVWRFGVLRMRHGFFDELAIGCQLCCVYIMPFVTLIPS